MNKTTFVWVVAVGCLAFESVGLGMGPQGPEDLYESRYGGEGRSVEASKDPERVVAFAKKLLSDALSIRDEPAFAEFLFERAYDFGSKDVAGYPAAIEAAKAILLKPVPTRAGWKGNSRWQARLVSLARFWYQQASPTERPAAAEQLAVQLVRSGDEQGFGINLEAATTFFAEAVRVAEGNKCPSLPVARGRLEEADGWKRRPAYEAALKANPNDAPAVRGLALFWLLETENPSQALPYFERTGDERLKKYGPLAVGSVEDVGEPDLVGLGDWWRAQASDRIGRAKATALRNAVAAYARFLEVHPQPDGMALTAKKALEEVTKQMKGTGEGPVEGPLDKGVGMGVRFFSEVKFARGDVRHVCYVIHNSGKMLTAFDQIVDKLKDSIGELQETQNFHVVFFAKDTFQESPTRRLVPASDANKVETLKFLREIRAAGYGSSPIPALDVAFKALHAVAAVPGEGKVLFLLTDGDFDVSAYKYKGLVSNEAVTRWLRDNNSDKSVHVCPVVIGEKPGKETEEAMRKIASENGGQYTFVERMD